MYCLTLVLHVHHDRAVIGWNCKSCSAMSSWMLCVIGAEWSVREQQTLVAECTDLQLGDDTKKWVTFQKSVVKLIWVLLCRHL